ncbi:hypothetical protein LOTGIDRAFT_233431 [Lottia gigantea]|uniref:CARD domain-containing protein n=1 Tax=Lottia gigantea TaxID=225164 RepID=V4AE87_LOTGI|nr:hypothetical protein LOTGIDRAFT_233431 [Lottia gigantea]ESO91661.1 hypothetical protein LOTGIDRAFT_233431 [Lottia gigantea]
MAEYKEPLPKIDEDILTDNHEELVRQITPKDIYNSLFQRRVIDLDELNKIKQEERQHGRRAGVEELLERIHRSGPKGLERFIDSLKSSGYRSLAQKLQESRQTKTEPVPETDKSTAKILQESCETRTNRTNQEKPSEPRVEENDNRFEKNDVKPNKHGEILRNNYNSIMDTIRVDDIIDHLYTERVIEWNDMDVIRTKLKSEGNREALRYLMDIIIKFSHTALPTFIDCLKHNGYGYIAKLLQDELKSCQSE